MLSEVGNIVASVGELLLQWRESGIVAGEWDGPQFKAQADLMAHEELTEKLANLAPDVPIISEESQASWVDIRPECHWLIDPIDGTASFVQGYSGFVTQVALIVDRVPQLAAICVPAFQSLYTAERGQGAFLNGVRLFREQTFPPKVLIDNYPEPRGVTLQAYSELHFTHYIECGSISLKICKVADGSADVFFKTVTIRDWDLAAAHLVMEETGGFLTDIYGNRIEYTRGYETPGVVAASHPDSIELLVGWYTDFSRRS